MLRTGPLWGCLGRPLADCWKNSFPPQFDSVPDALGPASGDGRKRFASEGFEGLPRGKTRRSRIAKLASSIAERVSP
jgi:hypothetical protein